MGTNNYMKKILLLIIFMLMLVLSTSSDSAVAESGNNPGINETITVSGAWALYLMMIHWAEEFQKTHPNVQFNISAGGAGKGMSDAVSGAVDIGMVSRDIYPDEAEQGAFWVAVTKDAVFLTVNADNPVLDDLYLKGISREIYITGEITTWGMVVVTHLLRQAHRLTDYVIFLWMGSLVESGPAEQVFNHPKDERTRAYLSGTIG
jgi:phosphate transport system substrate-binding protein